MIGENSCSRDWDREGGMGPCAFAYARWARTRRATRRTWHANQTRPPAGSIAPELDAHVRFCEGD